MCQYPWCLLFNDYEDSIMSEAIRASDTPYAVDVESGVLVVKVGNNLFVMVLMVALVLHP
jgi:hypothetical protein